MSHRMTASVAREVSRGTRQGCGVGFSALPPQLQLETQEIRFCCGRRFVLRIARSVEERRRAWALAYEVYRAAGYIPANPRGLWYAPHDLRKQNVTFLVESEGWPAAAVTLVLDDSGGVPSAQACPAEIEGLRAQGRRLAEPSSLVVHPDARERIALVMILFKLAYLTARPIEGATDFVIEVVPHHAPFYQQRLLFSPLTEPRIWERGGRISFQLLRLDLLSAEARYRERFGSLPASRNLHRFFRDQAGPLEAWIRRNRNATPCARAAAVGAEV